MKKSELIMMAKKIFLNENKLNELFAKSHTSKDKQILRTAIIAEFDAVNLYEQLSELAESKKIKRVLLDIAREEKTHIGEFKSLLNSIDDEQVEEDNAGEKEIKEL
jgi:rubrerythrin